jgi:hypothetical protein
MKQLAAVAAAVALLSPSLAAAAGINVRVLEGAAVRPEIVSLSAESGDESRVEWEVTGDADLELLVRCKGGERLRVEHDGGALTYVQCSGRNQIAYRADDVSGQRAGVTLSVTGDRPIRVATVLRAYDADPKNRGSRPRDIDRVTVKVLPDAEEEDEE